ncbi:MAG: helix-turn-helix domain-containing protein [Clostridiales bacterium]|nr:helix-turn-helix domain-containing protein [Clostridiales bacterium]
MDEIYVICPELNRIFSGSGYYTYATLSVIQSELGAEEADLLPDNAANQGQLTLLNGYGYAPYFVVPIYGENGETLGSMVVSMKAQEFLHLFYDLDAYFCCLFSQESGQYLCSVFSTTVAEDPDWYDNDYVNAFLGAQVSCAYLEEGEYTYMVAVLDAEYTQPLRIILIAFAAYFLLLLTLAVAYTWRSLSRRYGEISSLVDALPENGTSYGSYEEVLPKVRSSLADFQVQQDDVRQRTVTATLRNILFGRYVDSALDEKLLAQARLQSLCGKYYVVAFSLSNIEELLPGRRRKGDVSAMINVMIHSSLEGLSGQELLFTSCTDHSNILVVFGTDREEDFRENVQRVCTEVNELLRENYSINTQAVVSSLCPGPSALPDAYQEVLQLHSFLNSIDSKAQVVFQEDLDTNQAMLLDGTFLRKEHILINTLPTEKFDLVPGMVNAILAEHVVPLRSNYVTASQRLVSIANVLSEGVLSANLPPEEAEHAATLLHNVNSVSQLNEAVAEIFGQIAKQHASNERSEDNLLLHACNYIENNLYDMNLNVAAICEDSNISFQYLTRLFRKKYNRTIAEYISFRRIAKAKELLKNTNMTVAAIAQSVGYSSVDTLTGNFRKLEDLTSTEYRKL